MSRPLAWIVNFSARGRHTPTTNKPRFVRLQLELLECRLAPSVTLIQPGDQHSTDGNTVNLRLLATETTSHPLIFSAVRLPPGLNAGNVAGPFGSVVTGHVWGTIASGAHLTSPFHATATVTDSITHESASQSFNWYVAPRPATMPTPGISVPGLTVGANVNTAGANPHAGAAAGNQRETTVAINPTNSNQVFCASNTANVPFGLYGSYSTDGGANWTPRVIATGVANPNDSLPGACCDPQATFDSFGNLYLTYVTSATLWSGRVFIAWNDAAPGTCYLGDTTPGVLWQPDEWAGYTLRLSVAGGPTYSMRIMGNSGATLTLAGTWGAGDPPANAPYTIVAPGLAGTAGTVVVAYSADGGQNFIWLARAESADQVNLDYPRLTTGPFNTDTNSQTLWVTYRVTAGGVGPAGAPVQGIWSTWARVDGNTPAQITGFSTRAFITGSIYARAESIAIGPTGKMMISWANNQTVGVANPILVRISSDGTNWANPVVGTPDPAVAGSPSVTDTRVAYQTNAASGRTLIAAQPGRGISATTGLAWDRSGRVGNATDGVLYLVWTDAVAVATQDFTAQTDIYYMISYDSGAHWIPRAKVNNDIDANNSQFFPAVSVDQTTGLAAVAWYDCRNDENNVRTEIYATVMRGVSQVGGSPPPPALNPRDFEVPVTDVAPSDATALTAASSAAGYGDYMGIAYYGGVFIPCWTANPGGEADSDIFTARVTVSS